MRHYQTIGIRRSKYFRDFQYGDDHFFFHSCLGNPVKVSAAYKDFISLIDCGITLRDLRPYPELMEQVKHLLSKQLLEYENSKDLLAIGIEKNELAIASGELINLLVLDLHTACNMGCSYCYAAKTQEKHGLKGKAMSFDIARLAIDQFVALSKKNKKATAAVSYFGGEPLLNYKVLELAMTYVSALNAQDNTFQLTQAITTNGVLLTPQNVEDFKRNGCFVALSMDGLQEEHDKLRIYRSGGGTFARVEQSLKLLVMHKIPLEVVVTVGIHNTQKLSEFIDYLYSLGVRRVSIKAQIYTQLSSEERKEISRTVMLTLDYANKKGMLAKSGPGDLDYTRGCQGLGGLVCVEPSGDLFPCPEGSRIKIGTVHDFKNIPTSTGYHKIASRITGNLEQCKGCDVEGLCRGGCAGESEYRFDDIYKIDPEECETIRENIKQNLALYGKN
ncbi:UNVERIFIED_ORG: uncharacterized protein J2W82_000200 [Pseudomonas mohnii]|nr:uncharacterized protein [Pseudomonas mohnii]